VRDEDDKRAGSPAQKFRGIRLREQRRNRSRRAFVGAMYFRADDPTRRLRCATGMSVAKNKSGRTQYNRPIVRGGLGKLGGGGERSAAYV